MWIGRDAEKLLVNNQIRGSACVCYICPFEKVLRGLCASNYAAEGCVDEESGDVVMKEG